MSWNSEFWGHPKLHLPWLPPACVQEGHKGGTDLAHRWVEGDPVPCLFPGKAQECHTSLVILQHDGQPCRPETLMGLQGWNGAARPSNMVRWAGEGGATESQKQTRKRLPLGIFATSQATSIQQRQLAGELGNRAEGWVNSWETFQGGTGCRGSSGKSFPGRQHDRLHRPKKAGLI